jgi:hypothetical protein
MGFHCRRVLRHVGVFAYATVCVSSASTVVRAQAVVRGVLYDDASGAPLRGTVMLIDPRSDAAVAYTPTDSVGGFSLQTGQGVFQISAVRPGYKSVLSAPVPLKNGERLTIRVPIAENADPVHRIGVTEHIRPTAEAPRMVDAAGLSGYQARKALGTGLHFDNEQLSRNGDQTLGQFLRAVPGLSIQDPSSISSAQLSRNANLPQLSSQGSATSACHIGWFLDGHRVDLPGQGSDPLTDALGTTRMDAIEAVEVFRGVSEMPAEFAAPDLRCGAIAVWMRRG